jgi:hypothetical protein
MGGLHKHEVANAEEYVCARGRGGTGCPGGKGSPTGSNAYAKLKLEHGQVPNQHQLLPQLHQTQKHQHPRRS